jgi:hypothetical protein
MSHRVEPSVPGDAEGPQLFVGQAPLKPLCQTLAIRPAQAGTGSMSAGPSLAGDETRGETG